MRGKRWLWAAALIAVVGGGLWLLQPPLLLGRVGASFAAKQTCSCLHVGGRDMDSCRRDLDPLITRYFTFETSSVGVHVYALGGLFSSEARYTPGYGCTLTK